MFTYPDLSHYQAGLSLRGAALVVCKATQGTWFVDGAYASFRAQAARLRIPFIAYHWLDTGDAAAQARHCHATVGDTPLMIDDEQNMIDVAHTLAFAAAYRALGGTVHLEYAPRWLWQRSGSPSLQPFADAKLHVVASHYGDGMDSEYGWAAYGGVKPTVLQYDDAEQFNGMRVDFNCFPGSVDELMQLATGGVLLTETMPSGPMQGRTVAEVLNVLLVRTDQVTNHGVPDVKALVTAAQQTLTAVSATVQDVATAVSTPADVHDTVTQLQAASDVLTGLAKDLHSRLVAFLSAGGSAVVPSHE